jgi:hypothetical protein
MRGAVVDKELFEFLLEALAQKILLRVFLIDLTRLCRRRVVWEEEP